MRRYYFDVIDDRGVFVDDEGVECRDLQSVQTEAARALADMAREDLVREAVPATTEAPAHHMSINVRDDDGPVMQVRFVFEIHMQ